MTNKARLSHQHCRIWILIASIYAQSICAHDVPVHKQITLHAVASVIDVSINYNEFIATIGGPVPLSMNGGAGRTPMLWMIEGSAREDDIESEPGGSGGYRSLNHFYDPLGLAG